MAIFFAEYIIHLPLFNVLLGFPIQLLGLLSIPVRSITHPSYLERVRLLGYTCKRRRRTTLPKVQK